MRAPANPVLRGERIWLRPLDKQDANAYYTWVNDRELARLAGYWTPFSIEQVERWLEERVLKEHGEGRSFYFAICELGSDEFIGTTWLRDVRHGSGEFAIFLAGPQRWGKGYGTEALQIVCDFGFGSLGLERISLSVDPDNARAIRSYEKAGFTREGVLRHVRFHRGRYTDDLIMALLRDEWRRLDRKRSWEYGDG